MVYGVHPASRDQRGGPRYARGTSWIVAWSGGPGNPAFRDGGFTVNSGVKVAFGVGMGYGRDDEKE